MSEAVAVLCRVQAEKQVLAMGQDSPFLIQLLASFQSPDRLFFVMELVAGGGTPRLHCTLGLQAPRQLNVAAGEAQISCTMPCARAPLPRTPPASTRQR